MYKRIRLTIKNRTMPKITIIDFGNITVTNQEISFQQAGQIIAFISATSDGGTESSESSPAGTLAKQVSLAPPNFSPLEYLNEVGAKTNPEKILALAKYQSDYEKGGDGDFSSEEIQGLFERARQVMPKNFRRDFRTVMESAWIDGVSDKEGRYYITSTGEKVIGGNFSQETKVKITRLGRKVSVGSRRKATQQRGGSTVRGEVQSLEITPAMSGMPKYHDLKSKSDRILWILVAAKKLGIEGGLTVVEIDHIATKRLVDKSFSNIPTLTVVHRRNSLLTYDNGVYRPLHDGIEHIDKKTQ